MKITVVITTWQVPFNQVVRNIRQFDTENETVSFINDESKKWWDENGGERCKLEMPEGIKIAFSSSQNYEPIESLWDACAHYELWGGKSGFSALIDAESAAALHEEHYKREYDDKGKTRPGYLLNCYVAEGPEGEHVGSESKHEEYIRQQAAGMKAITDYYNKKAQH